MELKFKRVYQYYQILGLEKTATTENIRQAYRLIIRNYHPDINKDPASSEIAKKINEAFNVLSDPQKRHEYDNSEVECPKCWTYEVRRTQGNDLTSYIWKCTHCGYNFTFVAHKPDTGLGSNYTEYEEYLCPRCKKLLLIDESLGLYRCSNKSCKGVFSRYELRKYYPKNVRHVQIKQQSNVSSNNQNNPKDSQYPKKKEIKPFFLSSNEKSILLSVSVISTLVTLGFSYYVVFYFSMLVLGLFIIILGFSMLSWYIFKYPKTIAIIKSLINPK